MSSTKLIADSGATKAEWSLITNNKNKTVITQGISPYFLTTSQITELLEHELEVTNNINNIWFPADLPTH